MLDNVYALLKEQKKLQSEARIFAGSAWEPAAELVNLVFTTNTGAPVDKEYLKNSMDGIVKRINDAGISFEHITMHTFRHSFATRCIEKGMSPQILKTILGHSKLSMTMDLYAHVLPDTKAEEMQKISCLFKKSCVKSCVKPQKTGAEPRKNPGPARFAKPGILKGED